MSGTSASPFDALLAAVAANATARVERAEDRAHTERRALVTAAEDDVRALEQAAREIGQARGRAVEAALSAEARTEMRAVAEGAFDRLAERFLRRVRLALEGLPPTPRYAGALASWTRSAAARMDGPTEVFAAPDQREAVYDALLAAGAKDFRVRADRRVRCGFVVRDLDGRTRIDRRPDALLAEHAQALRALLSEMAPLPPEADAGDG